MQKERKKSREARGKNPLHMFAIRLFVNTEGRGNKKTDIQRREDVANRADADGIVERNERK